MEKCSHSQNAVGEQEEPLSWPKTRRRLHKKAKIFIWPKFDSSAEKRNQLYESVGIGNDSHLFKHMYCDLIHIP